MFYCLIASIIRSFIYCFCVDFSLQKIQNSIIYLFLSRKYVQNEEKHLRNEFFNKFYLIKVHRGSPGFTSSRYNNGKIICIFSVEFKRHFFLLLSNKKSINLDQSWFIHVNWLIRLNLKNFLQRFIQINRFTSIKCLFTQSFAHSLTHSLCVVFLF